MTQRVGSRSAKPRRRRSEQVLNVAVPAGVRLRVGPKAFWRLCAANGDLRLERTARGELIIMAPAGSDSGRQNSKLTMRLAVWAEADGSGQCFDSSAGFTLPNGAVRAPDASWIADNRWNALTPQQKKRFAPICPDFVIELRSPSDTKENVRAKMHEYIAQGARLGWMIDPQDATVEVYRPDRAPESLTRPERLSGEGVLPGFVLELRGILLD